ncbi:hypothetical protein BT96DRAFT_991843 [Gymnopus androsaceus JB14]|uniref:Uncharacterized protein n=1 Tax=Gymnopus androsaceus JB14 TaxID=1447944 RepID=A0A6A4HXL2_9AGAR|nr:hypothetical protein BT96DRAFT_991843 [Gymnopus androsaceus JB14]
MHERRSGNHKIPSGVQPETPVFKLLAPAASFANGEKQRSRGMPGSGDAEMNGGHKITAAFLESLVPPKRAPKYPPPLSIPQIPVTPSYASSYAPTMPRHPATPLLPSATFLSPVTPSTFIGSNADNANQFTPDITAKFSHLLPPLCPAKMLDSHRIERALEVLLDELHYSLVAEFISVYLQQIPRDSSESFGKRH